MAIRIGTVYLICFDERLKHAGHYLGWTADCRMLGMPALQCTAPGCESTGVGRDTKCAAHGGKLEDRNL